MVHEKKTLEQILHAEILCENSCSLASWPDVAGRCCRDTVHLFGEENSKTQSA